MSPDISPAPTRVTVIEGVNWAAVITGANAIMRAITGDIGLKLLSNDNPVYSIDNRDIPVIKESVL